jgi:hypothetical protein
VNPDPNATAVINGQAVTGTLARLYVSPTIYFGSMIVLTAVTFALTYSIIGFLNARERVRKATSPLSSSLLSREWLTAVFLVVIAAQLVLNIFAVQAVATGLRNIALFEVGTIFVAFAVIMHLYRYSQQLPF